MIRYYVLVGQTPVPEPDLLTWGLWFETSERRVRFSRLMDTVEVSTVFLGLDHGFREGAPILFETMAFWPGRDSWETDRCSTWLQAEAMHEQMCRDVLRPRSFLSFCRRALQKWWDEAREDWSLGWKDLQGIELSEMEVLRVKMREGMRAE